MEVDLHHILRSHEQLAELYGQPTERARLKQIDRLDEYCRAFIAASPFMLLATSGSGGGDCSPRGDSPGFVEVADDTTLLIPDRRGNNRVDSLKNILENPAVGLLFLIPGVNETFRVNGRAQISIDPALRERFVMQGKLPNSVLVVSVVEAFIQCPRALVRSELWNPEKFLDRAKLPSMGSILEKHTGGCVEAVSYDEQAKTIVPQTLY